MSGLRTEHGRMGVRVFSGGVRLAGPQYMEGLLGLPRCSLTQCACSCCSRSRRAGRPPSRHHDSGFPRTEIVVDGKPYGMLLDTGASFTMVSQAVLVALSHAHPEWERHDGAHGEAATLGGQTLETMYVPQAMWGTAELSRFGVTSQQAGVFEKWISSMTAEPVVGSLAGNVLKHFRVDMDYPNERLYLSR